MRREDQDPALMRTTGEEMLEGLLGVKAPAPQEGGLIPRPSLRDARWITDQERRFGRGWDAVAGEAGED